MLACVSFCLEYGADFFARVLCIPFVDDIAEGRKVVVLLTVAVHAVIDGDKPHSCIGKGDFRIYADFQIVASQTAHILYDNCSDLTVVDVAYKSLEVGTVKVRSRIPVVHIVGRVAKSSVLCILAEYSLLIFDTVAVAL